MAVAGMVGRADERWVLADLVRGARDGRSGAVVLEGDAGIGKTTLVLDVCAAAGSDALVLPGACLPLTSVSVPLLGLRSAVRGLPGAERPVCLGGDRGVPEPVPVAFDDWLTDEASARPVVLVVDDLHWADDETLDALTYVLAGPEGRRLAVILTVRSTDVGPHHPLHRWLADARRLPRVRELVVGPMTRDEIADQVSLALGGSAHTSLVDEVYVRSRGNPYFARLLVGGLEPSSRTLPPQLPHELSSAAVRSWSTLSLEARRLLVTLALGGRPVQGRSLDRVADIAGLDDPGPALHEAADAGLVDLGADGSVWFHHPLQAEALEQGLLPEERRVLHAGFALEYAHEAREAPTAELAETVSDHHHLAGEPEQAMLWARRAADLMHAAGHERGRLRMLRRAAAVLPQREGSREDRLALLREVQEVAATVGDWPAELEVIDELVALLDETDAVQALEVAVLLVRRGGLRFATAQGNPSDDAVRAVLLTRRAQHSPERRLALAAYAESLLWEERVEDGRAAVTEAFAAGGPLDDQGSPGVAPAAGGLELLSWSYALAAAAMLAEFDHDAVRGRSCGGRAAELALLAGEPRAFIAAAFFEANAGSALSSSVWVESASLRREQMEAAGFPPPYIAWLSAAEATCWFDVGQPQQCADRLRVALGSEPGPLGNAMARQAAALLACHQGRQSEAEAHLARAEELVAASAAHPVLELERCRATVRLASGDRLGTIDVALSVADREGQNQLGREWLLPLAARAIADLVDEARHRGADPSAHLERLEKVRARHPHVLTEVHEQDERYARVIAALDAVYRAEVARARADADVATAWVDAVRLLAQTELAWDEAYACRRAGEALLHRGNGDDRRAAAQVLRRGHALATRLGAAPELDAIEALARAARIPLQAAAAPGEPSADGARLTRREREVLAHVVAGRTYPEIAGALFLSEKTVSSHISNMLRKTGSANRVALAAWARRGATGG
jgi:DNA-binding CsgD family transcriptional regulator